VTSYQRILLKDLDKIEIGLFDDVVSWQLVVVAVFLVADLLL